MTMRALIVGAVLISLASSPQAADFDGDGLEDRTDNCLNVHNPIQCDADQDGFGNACDGDYDQDGRVQGLDSVFLNQDLASQSDSGVGTDADCNSIVQGTDYTFFFAQEAIGRPGPSGLYCAGVVPCVDGDFDGIADISDNCTTRNNPDQCDTDGDGYGNACDADFDNDGQHLGTDFTIFIASFGQPDGGLGTDLNCDGLVQGDDYTLFLSLTASLLGPGPSGLSCAGTGQLCTDEDLDSIADATDNCVGVPNRAQSDENGNGSGDSCESPTNETVTFVDNINVAGPSLGLEGSGAHFAALKDSDDIIHGFYASGLRDAQGVYHPRQALVYFSQSVASGPFSTTVMYTKTPIGPGGIGRRVFVPALNHIEEPCLLWEDPISDDGTALTILNLSCVSGDTLQTQQITGIGLNTLGGSAQLDFDSQGLPHIIAYQHGAYDGINHRVRHIWYDGTDWLREVVPLPSALLPPVMADARSSGGCLAIDASDRIHVAMGAGEDTNSVGGSNIFDDALIYAVKNPDPTVGWENSSVVRYPAANGLPGTSNEFSQCQLVLDASEFIHVLYKAETEWFYSRNLGNGWVNSDLGPLGDGAPTSLALDMEGRLFAMMGSNGPAPLVRDLSSGAANSVFTTILDSVALGGDETLGATVFVAPGANDSTRCEVMHARRRSAQLDQPSEGVLTIIENCEKEFTALPIADYEIQVP